jgi:ketosteroid isomerase-like protein
MNMRVTAVLTFAITLAAGCSESGPGLARSEIIEADKAFSAMSLKVGPKAAFLEYFGSDAKMLSEVRLGKEGVHDLFVQLPPTATLTWEPSYADAASSGDFGYTWGRYTLTVPSSIKGKEPFIQMGTYATIWKHKALGGWKVVLDGGHADGQK